MLTKVKDLEPGTKVRVPFGPEPEPGSVVGIFLGQLDDNLYELVFPDLDGNGTNNLTHWDGDVEVTIEPYFKKGDIVEFDAFIAPGPGGPYQKPDGRYKGTIDINDLELYIHCTDPDFMERMKKQTESEGGDARIGDYTLYICDPNAPDQYIKKLEMG